MNVHISPRVKVLLSTKLFTLIDSLLTILLIIGLVTLLLNSMHKLKTAPTQQATLQSNPEFKLAAQRISAVCSSKQGWDCYKREFSKVTKNNGLTFAENTLYAIQEINPFLRHCHIIAHAISQEVTRNDPSHWKELMEQVNIYSCGGGFLHGILETHMADNPDFTITTDFINDLCASFKEDEKKNMCAHSLAHLVLVEKEGNLSASLPVCARVTTKANMNFECYVGLFMEDHQKFALSEHGIAPLPIIDQNYTSKLQNDCLRYEGNAASGCWIDMAEIFAKLHNYDSARVHDSCDQAPVEFQRSQCYLRGIGHMATYHTYNSADKLVNLCSPYENQPAYEECRHWLITALMMYSPKFADRGILFCANIDESYRKNCFIDLGTQLKINVSSLSERETLCQGTPPEYKNNCISL